MKITSKKLLIGAIALLGATSSFAQFSLEGEYRPRFELRNGFKKPILNGQEPAAFAEHRARLTAGYKTEKYGFKMSIQDVRIWGETGQINKSDQLLSAHEAYGEYYASEKSTFRIGRQEVAYDGHRLIGTLGWAAQARAFDAVRYLYKDDKGNQFDAMASWNQTGFGDGAPEPAKLVGNTYATANGGGTTRIFNLGLPKAQLMAYYKKSFDKGDIGIMALHDIYNSAGTTDNTYSDFSLGISPNFKSGKLIYGGQFYYTGGERYSAGMDKNVDLSGYMVNLYLQHTGIKGAPLLGVDYLSGDDESTTEIEGWAPKYGTNHKFYGFMDYFYVGNGHGGGNEMSAGLIDLYLKTTFKVGEKSKLLAHLHYFAAPEKRTNSTSGKSYDGGLGTELDLVYVRPLTQGVVLKAGYSQMFGTTDTMKQLKFGDASQEIADMQSWGWVMISFTPKFL